MRLRCALATITYTDGGASDRGFGQAGSGERWRIYKLCGEEVQESGQVEARDREDRGGQRASEASITRCGCFSAYLRAFVALSRRAALFSHFFAALVESSRNVSVGFMDSYSWSRSEVVLGKSL
jgi:hypothetical protein